MMVNGQKFIWWRTIIDFVLLHCLNACGPHTLPIPLVPTPPKPMSGFAAYVKASLDEIFPLLVSSASRLKFVEEELPA